MRTECHQLFQSLTCAERIVTENINGVKGVHTYHPADVCWFGTPFICISGGLKNKLVKHFEDNKIQTRNYFTGNILLHPGYSFLDDYKKYPNANEALKRVFFLGCPPHYTEEIVDYIGKVLRQWTL